MTRAAFIVSPPDRQGSWEPIMQERAQEMIAALRELGVTVLEVPLDGESQDGGQQLQAIRAFRPDFMTAVNYNHLMLASVRAPDLFAMDIPIMALWDDPLGALVNLASWQPAMWSAKDPHRERLSLRRVGARLFPSWIQPPNGLPASFLPYFNRPAITHFAWDSGHARVVQDLGLAQATQIHWYPVATYRPFLAMGERAAEQTSIDVAFCGNVYLNSLKQSDFWKSAFHRSLTERMIQLKLDALERSAWDVMLEVVEALPRAVRAEHQLWRQRREFWTFYSFNAWCALNTMIRVELLRRVRRPVSLFGLFADPDSIAFLRAYPNLEYCANCHHSRELPRVYAQAKINLCISNGLIYQGMPSKLIDCLASGGFALCDPKEDLVRFFGPEVDVIFFRDADELNEKIDYFLPRPKERQAIVEALRSRIAQQCTTRRLFERVLATASECPRKAA